MCDQLPHPAPKMQWTHVTFSAILSPNVLWEARARDCAENVSAYNISRRRNLEVIFLPGTSVPLGSAIEKENQS